MNTNAEKGAYPRSWSTETEYDPNHHIMQLKNKDYLPAAERLRWFVNDQRALIRAGLATCSYIVKATLVDIDTERGYAHFSCYVRDVLGNETTMYGSETAKDFPDYAEKASTKAMARALLTLGYGTAFAPDMDEGERVADSPIERRASTSRPAVSPPAPATGRAQKATADFSSARVPADQQCELFDKLKATFGFDGYEAMDAWLDARVRGAETPRGAIGALPLRKGEADLNMAEQSLILGILAAQSKTNGTTAAVRH